MNSDIKTPLWSPACMDGFILDWDGVLANTRLDFQHVRDKYFGGQIVPLIERAAMLPPPLDEEAAAEIRRVEMEGADRATPVDGARELIEWLAENGRPWVVVSRNCRDSILLAAQRCGITLPSIVMSREESVAKPDPRALVLAAERMGLPPSRCVMVGDFVFDMLGARRVPMRCVLVEGDLAAWGHMADLACPTLRDLIRELKAPRPLVPWEYRGLVEERGVEELLKANQAPCVLKPEGGYSQALDLARRGVARIAVPRGAKVSLKEWEELDLPARFIDQPLLDVLRETLCVRWPAVEFFPAEAE